MKTRKSLVFKRSEIDGKTVARILEGEDAHFSISMDDSKEILRNFKSEFLTDEFKDNIYVKANEFMSDMVFFTEFMDRTKRSNVSLKIVPLDKLMCDMYKQVFSKNDVNDIVNFLCHAEISKNLLNMIYYEQLDTGSTETLVEKYLLWEKNMYWRYDLNLRDYISIMFGCSSGIHEVLRKISSFS